MDGALGSRIRDELDAGTVSAAFLGLVEQPVRFFQKLQTLAGVEVGAADTTDGYRDMFGHGRGLVLQLQ